MEDGEYKTFTFHTRPLTQTSFNLDGDLLVASSLDSKISIWNVDGKFLGSLEDHKGAVWGFSISDDGNKLVSGSSDCNGIVWDILSGKIISSVQGNSSVKSVYFLKEGFLYLCDNSYNQRPLIGFNDIRSKDSKIYYTENNPTKVISENSENYIIYSDIEGNINCLDRRNEKIITKKIHNAKIQDLKNSYCKTFFISSSLDSQAKIIDPLSLKEIRTFYSDDPVNSAAIFTSNDIIIMGGGISARDVTLTKGKKTFDVNFYDIITQKHIGHYSPHFGTINTVDVHPSGQYFCSGGEDGILSLIKFDQGYYNGIENEMDTIKNTVTF
ncbi:Eukaryotic translation initiation factor 3 subunitI EIF-3I [Spraguea lophii 42_110]|uniref:Serine-threonine kinase receptor-associated protein n=1 Tax=Spraguea lophii (strain 42_110) TaxID=1358809 RepID=S7WDS4_SPRLO|nr:Eukaryotic translation initiation factor 3 subunitI EIF-3I [Spraguea lophii 42_110]